MRLCYDGIGIMGGGKEKRKEDGLSRLRMGAWNRGLFTVMKTELSD